MLVWLMVLLKVRVVPSGGDKIVIPEQRQMGQVVKPATECTVAEHDMEKWKEEFQKLTLGFVVVVGIHYYWEAIVPLAVQSILAPVGVLTNKLFALHVLGQQVERPFPIALPFGSEGPAQEDTEGADKIDEKANDEKADETDKPAEEKKDD